MQRQLGYGYGYGYDDPDYINGVLRVEFPKNIQASAVDPTLKPQDCDINSLACGWLVYVPFTKEMNYFMKNT